jgi:hypothetical protein
MWENVIGFHIGRCNRNLFFVNAGILAVIFVCAYFAERYLYNCLVGPFPTTQGALAKVTDPKELRRYFVVLDQLQPIQTGLRYVETNSQKVTATYFAIPIDSRFLLIKSPESVVSARYEGGLVAVPEDVREYFQRTLLVPKHLQFAEAFLPYSLDASSFRSDSYWALLFVIPLTGLAVVNICKSIIRLRSIEASPIARSLLRFSQPPETVAISIDQDLKTNPDRSCIRSVHLTPSWLLHKSMFSLTVLHWSEIVWVYQKVTSHYYNLIPTGKTYGVTICDEYGRRIEVDVGRWKAKDATARFLQILVNQLPWIAVGYNDELKRTFEKDRAGFVATVHERQRQFTKG